MPSLRMLLLSATLGALAAPGQASLTASNPIIPGFNPDPTICRVGDDFYVATTTCEYFPGVPIYHSRDLVNWRLIGHALDRPSALNLDGVECSSGIYAPTLRQHDGTFYLVTTLTGTKGRQGGNFVVTARNPAGPWSDPVWIENAPGIDPSLFFDADGRLYYCGNGRPEKPVHEKHRFIWIQEMDRQTFQLKGPRTILDSAEFFINGKLGPVNNLEAPHIYRVGDHYYLVAAHGGTGTNHAVSVWRGRSPLGPWEINPANPVLTHRDRADSPAGITCTGHVDLTEGPDGSWWAVLLAVRSEGRNSTMGRETFLARVSWEDGWPVFNAHERRGRIGHTFMAPAFARSVPRPADEWVFREGFDAGPLGRNWTFIRTPRQQWWNVADGQLRIAVRPEEITDLVHPSFAGIRLVTANSEVTTRVRFAPQAAHEAAGLAILRARDSAWSLMVESSGSERAAAVYFGRERLGGITVAPAGDVELRIRLVERTLAFLVRTEAGNWQEIVRVDATPLFEAPGGRFTGVLAGVYATSRGQPSSNQAAFDSFEIIPAR